MRPSEAFVTRSGQVTIPDDIRRAMGLTGGERVVFTQLDDGTVVIRAKRRSIVELRGSLKRARAGKRPDPPQGHERWSPLAQGRETGS